ncbi:MAG: prolipoprotein diacylglyceryl transferase [Eubacteriaceae bacterium]|nr:prolipoprotein diacylglyceryl transferase [Eubacteriaceae bacterium]
MTPPNPIAFTVFGFSVRWYGVLIALALLIGLYLAIKRAQKRDMDIDVISEFFLWMVPAIIIGARLYYVIFEWPYYAANPGEIIALWHGGLAIHGGILAGVLTGIIFCKVKNISFFELADVVIVSLPLGQAIGRWGNFFNGEAYGSETDLPWAITVDDPIKGMISVHPTFLYESLWNLAVFFFLLYYEKKHQKNSGELLFLYLICYSIGRFFIEGLRTDSLMFFSLKAAQLISLALIAIGVAGLIWLRRQKEKD